LPGYKEGVVIQPGLFKGTYGDHGLELVLLTYEDEDNRAVITKITVSVVLLIRCRLDKYTADILHNVACLSILLLSLDLFIQKMPL